jgi:predicted DNA-binding transcriptional regulator AlpA
MSKRRVAIPAQDKLLLSVDEAAALLGVGRDRIYKLIMDICRDTKRPALYSVKVGARRLIPRQALDRYIDSLMAAA